MRERTVDAVLILTLVVVAFGITWTLLSLNRTQGRQPDEAEPAPAASATLEEVEPLPAAGAERSAPAAAAPAPAGRTEDAQPRDEPEAPDTEPIPPGDVRLGRIGFSYATGAVGACGVPLEPWRHVAVSRELLAAYGCGAEVRLMLDEPAGGRREATLVVADTMDSSYLRTANIYVAEDEPALEYGVTTGILRP